MGTLCLTASMHETVFICHVVYHESGNFGKEVLCIYRTVRESNAQ